MKKRYSGKIPTFLSHHVEMLDQKLENNLLIVSLNIVFFCFRDIVYFVFEQNTEKYTTYYRHLIENTVY